MHTAHFTIPWCHSVYILCTEHRYGIMKRSVHTLVDSNGLSARVAVLGEHAVEAGQAVGPTLPHDVALTAQVPVTLETGEVLHVPGPALRLRALVRKNYLKIKNNCLTFQKLVL